MIPDRNTDPLKEMKRIRNRNTRTTFYEPLLRGRARKQRDVQGARAIFALFQFNSQRIQSRLPAAFG